MTAPASLLLAARTLVQFPRNPILLGFSLAPVLMMFLVFGALFEGDYFSSELAHQTTSDIAIAKLFGVFRCYPQSFT